MFTRDRFQTDPVQKSDRIGLLFTRDLRLEPVRNGPKTGPAVLQVLFWIRSGPVPEMSGVNTWTGVTADFVPPPILSPRTKSASGYCPPGQYPLADIVPPSPNLSPPQQLLFKLCFPLTQ